MTPFQGSASDSCWAGVAMRGECLEKLKARSGYSSGAVVPAPAMAADPADWDPGAQPRIGRDGAARATKRKGEDDDNG